MLAVRGCGALLRFLECGCGEDGRNVCSSLARISESEYRLAQQNLVTMSQSSRLGAQSFAIDERAVAAAKICDAVATSACDKNRVRIAHSWISQNDLIVRRLADRNFMLINLALEGFAIRQDSDQLRSVVAIHLAPNLFCRRQSNANR